MSGREEIDEQQLAAVIRLVHREDHADRPDAEMRVGHLDDGAGAVRAQCPVGDERVDDRADRVEVDTCLLGRCQRRARERPDVVEDLPIVIEVQAARRSEADL
jgi:hypothetical protein